MAIFGQKPWVNPFAKISIFRLFLTCCFDSLETRFLSLEYQQQQHQKLYLHDHKGITVLQKLIV